MNSGPFLTGSAPSSATEARSSTLMPHYQSLQRLGQKKAEIDNGGLAFSRTTLPQYGEHSVEGQCHYRTRVRGTSPEGQNFWLAQAYKSSGQAGLYFQEEVLGDIH